MALIPRFLGTYCRACFYKQTLNKSSPDLDIGFGSIFSNIETSVGRGVLITGYTTIGLAEIGDYAVIANHVSVLSGRYHHNFKDMEKRILDGQDTFIRIAIGDNSFIGDNSTVMADIGKNSIVGAGSVVVKPVPDNVVVVGNPARVVKKRGD
ncbi:Acetyltransferase-like protein [Candidatus Zixiibacteriota bacterium]|nr:Acetyltransferase-like protein [candidate division Zixibacteria bacterium]